MAERVFAQKLVNVGFHDVEVIERHPFGLEDAARYPLFTSELIALMQRLIPRDRQAQVAVAITVCARKPHSTKT